MDVPKPQRAALKTGQLLKAETITDKHVLKETQAGSFCLFQGQSSADTTCSLLHPLKSLELLTTKKKKKKRKFHQQFTKEEFGREMYKILREIKPNNPITALQN